MIELPDTTTCGFINYIFAGENGLLMGAKSLDTELLLEAKKAAEREGADNA